MKNFTTLALALGLGAHLGACGGEEATDPTLSQVEQQVFAASCAFSSCHQGAAAAGGLNLEGSTHAKLVGVDSTQVAGRKLVVAGNPDASYLMDKLRGTNLAENTVQMPPGMPLEAERIELVRAWIAAGAQND